ncbi:hypothetical protein BH11MYX4_BH11MYX4_12710 [soil metagenome]
MPSLQTMRAAGTSSVTFGEKVRSEMGTRSSSFSPRAIEPLIELTVEFQRGKSAASVRRAQTRSGAAWMVMETRHSMRKVDAFFWLIESVVMPRPRSTPPKGCGAPSFF